mgnify:CR=1 FL=1
MTILDSAKQRVRAFLDEVRRLADLEFPYNDSKDALAVLQALFERKLGRLEALDETNDPAVVSQEASLALRSLFVYLPLLGFVLRSTNVRNAFEVFRPFLRLATQVLEPDQPLSARTTRLLLSSEWEYSPFTYQSIPDLPGFVLIGIPAPESANPLLLPLAGHELGHTVWVAKKVCDQVKVGMTEAILTGLTAKFDEFNQYTRLSLSRPEDLVGNLFALTEVKDILEWAVRQGEETFCDLLGLRLFGEAYLFAFAYLLAPGSGDRIPWYPSLTERVGYLVQAAADWHLTPPLDYEKLFGTEVLAGFTAYDSFKASIADQALRAVFPVLVAQSKSITEAAGVRIRLPSEVTRIGDRLALGVPAEHCDCIADIVNAAWAVTHAGDLWSDIATMAGRKEEVLKELVLKNLEVFEFEQLVKRP